MLPASQVSPQITSNKLWSSFSSSCGGWAETLLGHWEHGGVVGAKGKGNHLSKSINFSWNNVVIEHLRLRLRGFWRRSWWNWIHRRYTTSTRADTRSYSLRRGWILNIIKIEQIAKLMPIRMRQTLGLSILQPWFEVARIIKRQSRYRPCNK